MHLLYVELDTSELTERLFRKLHPQLRLRIPSPWPTSPVGVGQSGPIIHLAWGKMHTELVRWAECAFEQVSRPNARRCIVPVSAIVFDTGKHRVRVTHAYDPYLLLAGFWKPTSQYDQSPGCFIILATTPPDDVNSHGAPGVIPIDEEFVIKWLDPQGDINWRLRAANTGLLVYELLDMADAA